MIFLQAMAALPPPPPPQPSAKLLGEAELVVDFSTPSTATTSYEGRCVGYTRVAGICITMDF